ncbi:MAG: class I SAM-dependent methyltransferase family protein [archaeon]
MIIRVEKKKAEKLRRELAKRGLLEQGAAGSDEKYVYFGFAGKAGDSILKRYGAQASKKKIRKRAAQPKSIMEVLRGRLPEGELKEVTRAYDVIGDIAVLLIKPELEKRERLVAEAILKVHKNVKTVVKRLGKVEGEYRVRDVEFLAGEKRTETTHREHGCRYLLDVSKVFFTPRLATERLRVAKKVKKDETVLDMFAGVGPFAVLIAKTSGARVIAVEINPDAVEYMRKNVGLNKVDSLVEVREGDARDVCRGFKVDRVVMNLPKMAEGFLPVALGVLKPEGVVHYHVLVKGGMFEEKILETKGIVESNKRKFRLLEWNKGRQVSPKEWIACIDFNAL